MSEGIMSFCLPNGGFFDILVRFFIYIDISVIRIIAAA
jgi:hypothetical protein